MRTRHLRNRRGSAMLWVLGVGITVGIAALIVPGLLKRSAATAFDVEREFEAQLLAANIREIAKYLVLYEKVFYTGMQGGFLVPGGEPTRIDADIVNVWGQTFTSLSAANMQLITACGGYNVNLNYMGVHNLANKPVFCPSYFRSNLFTGMMAEEMLFEQWANVAPVLRKPDPNATGTYFLQMDFTRALEPDASRFVGFDPRMKILKEKDKRNLQALVTVSFSTDGSGFRAIASERYINFHAEVTFDGQSGNRNYVEDNETVMMTLSTPKEFALFMPYPDGNLAGDFLASVNMAVPSAVQFNGRVFFNGDLNLGNGDMGDAIDALPVFQDAVVLTGTFLPSVPGPKYLDKLKQKFKKGIVTNYSAARFLFDGQCAGPVDGVTQIQNQSQIPCAFVPDSPGTPCQYPTTFMQNYIQQINRVSCGRGSLVTSDVDGISFQPPGDEACFGVNAYSGCDNGATPIAQWKGAAPGEGVNAMIRGGFRSVEVASKYAFIVSPVETLKISKNGANIYGLVVGGHVDIPVGSANFYSLAALAPGVVGIPDDATVGTTNQKASQSYQGTAVPLLNMPVVYSSREGVR